MKIAISSTGKEIDSKVDPRFGRADYLVIVETASGAIVQVIDNLDARNASQGAGINAASRIAEAGAQVILTGRVGPKAADVCEKAGIEMVNDVSGTVDDAVQQYIKMHQTEELPVEKSAGSRSPAQNANQGSGRGQGQGGSGRGRGRGKCSGSKCGGRQQNRRGA